MNYENASQSRSFPSNRLRFFSSFGWKVAVLVFIGLVLLIPLSMIHGLLRERQDRKAEAVQEIGQQWGAAQRLYGPFLRVPVDRVEERSERVIEDGVLQDRIRTVKRRDFLVVLPEAYRFQAKLDPEIRYRGIFRAPVYTSEVSLGGFWKKGAAATYGLGDATIAWGEASVIFRVFDAKGLSRIEMEHSNEGDAPSPIYLGNAIEWIAVRYPVSGYGEEIPLSLNFELQGSDGISFMQVGREGEAAMSGNWPDPSFTGSRLPVERKVTEGGFAAKWRFGEFGRSYAQHWIEQEGSPGLAQFESGMSGVQLMDPVDGYRLTERSLKYGSLFIALGFLVFFLFEVLCKLQLHPMHYLLAGAAQALFFLLVLAMSEVVSFGYAYALAAGAATGLIAFYAASVLRGSRRAVIVGGALVGLYGVLFVILREQDYALLAGSGLLFFALATVMWLTRKLDWSMTSGDEQGTVVAE